MRLSALLLQIGLPFLAGCANVGGAAGELNVIGDENGGKIPRSVGAAASQSSAYALITAHCAKFGKKGFITRMDYESGTMTFECRSPRT